MKKETEVIKRRKYDDLFKAEVLKMVSAGRPVSEVAHALGIGENLIYQWKSRQKAQLKETLNQQAPGESDLLIENERLKAALRKTEQERDILKKALHIFSRET
jgi:transposase